MAGRSVARIPAGLMAVLVAAAAALSPARLEAQGIADPAARRVPMVGAIVRQRNGQNLVRMNNGALLMLPDWLTLEPTPGSDGNDDPAANDDAGWRARVSDAGFDHSLFAGYPDAATARQQLVGLLQHDIDALSEKYALSPVQRDKLLLAGRGDVKRLFDRVEGARRRLQARVIADIAGIQELNREMSRELTPLRASLKTGTFGEGSLFAKMLKSTLTIDQIAAYEKWKRDHPVSVTYSWDLRVR
jgi:hypothetical protein